MKKVIVGVEDEGLIKKLLEENKWLFKSGDFTDIKSLYILANSKDLTLDLPLLIKFDTTLTNLKKYASFIIDTKQNIIIFTENINLIPEGIKRVCDIERSEVIHPCINILRKIGVDLKCEDMENISISQLIKYLNVNWDKFESKEDVFKLLVEVNKKLYKVGEDWLKLYLIWGFPTQKRKTFFRYPVVRKKGIKEKIIEKIGKYYGMSSREVNKSWWLLRRLMNSDDVNKYELDDEELKLLGIKRVKKREEDKGTKEKKKYRSLLE